MAEGDHLLFRTTPIGPGLTKVGIVYSKTSGHVRGHVYPAHDDHFVHHNLLPGEAMCFVDIAHHHAGHDVFHSEIRKAVQAHGNVAAVLFHHEPGSRMYARVNPVTNVVENVTMACPDCDQNLVPENWIEFVSTDAIGHGDTYDPATKEFVKAPLTLPAKPGRPETIVPERRYAAINPP